MKKNNILFSLILFLCFEIYVIAELRLPFTEKKEFLQQVKQMKEKSDSLLNKNVMLDQSYEDLLHTADSLNLQIYFSKQTILQIENKEQKKNEVMDSSSVEQLMNYFSGFHAKVLIEDKDSLFCFPLTDCKTIAKDIEGDKYCDSVVTEMENELYLLLELQIEKNSSIHVLTLKVHHLEQLIHEQLGAMEKW